MLAIYHVTEKKSFAVCVFAVEEAVQGEKIMKKKKKTSNHCLHRNVQKSSQKRGQCRKECDIGRHSQTFFTSGTKYFQRPKREMDRVLMSVLSGLRYRERRIRPPPGTMKLSPTKTQDSRESLVKQVWYDVDVLKNMTHAVSVVRELSIMRVLEMRGN